MADEDSGRVTVSRRRLLKLIASGLGAVAVAGVTGYELVDHGVLPGKQILDQLDGACSVPTPSLTFIPAGGSISGRFYSQARHRSVGYTIAHPHLYTFQEHLPLIVMLHGYGNNHSSALFKMTPGEALSLLVNDELLRPMAMVTVDGGDGYWNPHPGDDPMSMVVDELIPMCQRLGFGVAPHQIGMMGISMGGYGALAIAERNPGLVSAVAAISPAIWTSYNQAHGANAGAFSSAKSFQAGDVIAHVDKLKGIAVRVASGVDDPFHAGVEKLATVLPASATVDFVSGCHTEPFFISQEPSSLEFLAAHLS
jgi:pimeloyl-ACP methyl ester carboxylesterase